jgi:hypothetical protein
MQLENEMRKEERAHEMGMLRMILSPRQPAQFPTVHHPLSVPIVYANQSNVHPTEVNSDFIFPTNEDATYCKL